MVVDLSPETKTKLIVLLKIFSNVFTWQPAYMERVDSKVIEHSLNIVSGSVPIKHKKRGQPGDMIKAINEEVAKPVCTDILWETIFTTWIAKPVMLKKHDGS